ncbi:acetyl-CoA C-acetyltransferase [Aerococcus viridans]|uniref:acetyl-CoA C-acetyltransferase n=2 Tax=Aerococcus viridans TaxID=1377 RepID=A0AAU8U4X2_9LACT|nr:acetyl-CoA C-acetyltransferase [Aerococcus viridans]AMC01032.1 acetyl-CoA acetyltransferase [Aerococcus viridans]EFG49481.1 acetyl-CoA C-acetyltransferase [Aerococcus viridans ATCC 11563 = CCUG 4311]MEC1386265.1 acetyl-CoA C-acetyltransferase [Aerococcus viridans]SUU03983.1 Acetyl-CoA acetyltransferase [Aerococcus viridans]
MEEVVIVAAKRSAIGKFGGQFKGISAVELGVEVLKETLASIDLDPTKVEQVILGNVLSAGLGQNVARQVALKSGLSNESTAVTINQVCGSGLRTVMMGAQAIMLGDADIVVAGGTENMTRAPYVVDSARWGQRMGNGQMIDTMLHDGLTDAFSNDAMGITAENIADQYGISREAQDEFAAASQVKAVAAKEADRFAEEIVPVTIQQKNGTQVVAEDEGPRSGITAKRLGKLQPAFKEEGTVTAGNSSSINDGAAMLVLMSKRKADELGLKPMVSIASYATGGVDPSIMGTGPIPTTIKALEKANITAGDLDLIEANEAFASQALCVTTSLELPAEKVNVNGGAIALGHPIGASGARILVTLIHEMQKRQSVYGLATLCVGGGQGVSVIVKQEV